MTMNKEQLRDILLLQNEKITEEEFLIERELLKKIAEFEDTPFVIIISGVRRCGKSTLLKQIRPDDSYYINFDDERFVSFSVDDFQQMYEMLIELFGEQKKFFFDEIQNIKGWERFVRRLHSQKNKIYVTGSNASMLSKELGTHLTGRHIALELFPFSFREYLRFKNYELKELDRLTSIEKSKIKNIFLEFLDKGGFPEYLQTGKTEYLQSLYENILYRDIIVRYKLRSEKPLKVTAHFAASNVGKELSFNSIKNLTGLTSATTVKEYFQYLENSYLMFLLPMYSDSLKKQIYNNKKVYCIDSKLVETVGFRFSQDRGRILENTVFLQLKRQRKEIYYHREKKECDFVIKEGNAIVAVMQVTWSLDDENKKREIDGLMDALNSYDLDEGLILTFDQEDEFEKDDKHIVITPVWKWLLGKKQSLKFNPAYPRYGAVLCILSV